MWALRTVGWRASRLFVRARPFSYLQPQSEEMLMAAQSVARILDAHESSVHLSTLNQALNSILQVSSPQSIDRVSLSDKRCVDLVNKVLGRIGEMNVEDLVQLGEWLAKAKSLRVGWRELTFPERESFRNRLKLLVDLQDINSSQMLSLMSTCSALGLSFKSITGVLEKKLEAPEVQFSMTDIQRLLELLSKTSKMNGRIIALVIGKLQGLDTSLMDPKGQVSIYNSLCSLEVGLQSDQVNRCLEEFLWEVVSRVQNLGEEELLEWTSVHARLKYPRLEVTRTILSEVSRRLEKADMLSKNFVLSILKPLTLIRTHHRVELPTASLSKLLTEVSKHISSQFVYPSDFETAVRMSMQLTSTFPLAFTLAVKRKAQSYTREVFWLPTVLHYCELVHEDSSFCHSLLDSVVNDLHNFPVTDRLTLLNGIYMNNNLARVETLEKCVISSFHDILNEMQLHRSLNLLHRILMHRNKQLIKKVDFVRKQTLEQLFLAWPQDVPKHWILFLSYFTHRGNEALWERFIKQVKMTPTDYIHSVSLLSAEDHCLEPALLALEHIASSATPDNIFFTHKLFEDNTDLILLERFAKIVEKVDLRATSSAVISRSVDFMLKHMNDTSIFPLLPTYLSTLYVMHQQPPADMDLLTKGKLIHLLMASGHLDAAQAMAYVKEHMSKRSTAMIATSIAALILPQIKEAGLLSDLLRVLNDRRLNDNIVVARLKCNLIARLPGDLPTESSRKQLLGRLQLLREHLCPLLIDIIAALPCRLLTEQDIFIQSFIHMLMKRNPEQPLSPRSLVRLLKVLAKQRMAVGHWRELVNVVLDSYKTLSVSSKVELLEVAATWGFQDAAFRVCLDISSSPLDYLHVTGRILGALSDGNLQHSLSGAQVAESLVFSPNQTFSLSKDALAQVLMFCVRIGMEDTQIIRKLLALPPPFAPGQFNLKRYLLHLYYKDRETAHFSLKSELSEFTAALKSTAWQHFHTSKDLNSLAAAHPGLVTQTFRNDLYLSVLDEEKKKAFWPVPTLAVQIPGHKELLGDYQFYLQMCKQVAGVEVEPVYSSKRL